VLVVLACVVCVVCVRVRGRFGSILREKRERKRQRHTEREITYLFTPSLSLIRYKDSLLMLSKYFGWDKSLYLAEDGRNENGRYMGMRETFTQEIVDAVDSIIQFDTPLYRFATCLFERRLRILALPSSDPSCEDELSTQSANRRGHRKAQTPTNE